MTLYRALSILCVLTLLFVGGEASARPAPDGFADLAEKLAPAVVNISTTQKLKASSQNSPFQQLPQGHPFEEFNELFKRFIVPKSGEQKATSLGSGFIVDPEGYIVTNNHVVERADEITVTLGDDTQYVAKLLGMDPKTDLALLKIESEKPLPYVEFGDSDESRVGDWVIVIGNPFGLGGTVTAGIISARARDINSGPFDDFLQTDAAINRGNSGGPMFNLKGEVIGINTAIYSPNGGGSVGIGFAVPSVLAKPIIKQLKETGTVRRGWLGVKIQHVTEEIADSLGLEEGKGALVAEVIKGSPAEAAKIQSGDVILSFDGKEVDIMKKLPRIVAETEIDKQVEVTVWRDGAVKTLQVYVGELNEGGEEKEPEEKHEEPEDQGGSEVLNMYLEPLSDELRERYAVSEDINGLVIVRVERGSVAAERGMKRGDVILKANQELLRTVDSLRRVVEQAEEEGKKAVLLLVHRNNDTIFVALPLGEEE